MLARKIDSLGRITIPAGILSLADISKLEYVRLTIEDNKILIKRQMHLLRRGRKSAYF